jgi:hypothetical protein
MLAFRIGLYVVVLFLVAIVVVAQHHTNARDTLRAVVPRTIRWGIWSAVLLVSMLGLELMFIGW